MTVSEQLESGKRDAGATIHDMDERRRQVVVDIPHDRVDTFRTSFGPDCFRESFAKRKPTMIWQHNREKVIGSARSAEVLPEVNRIVGQFSDFDAVPLAHEVYANLRDGHIRDFSFFFDNARSRPHPKERGVKQFVKADMIEFSPVVAGSVPGAGMVGLRSQDPYSEAFVTIERLERHQARREGDYGRRSLLSPWVTQNCVEAGWNADIRAGYLQKDIERVLERLDRRLGR